jgi:energy-coupling factor transporter transmembrane protein EcfT
MFEPNISIVRDCFYLAAILLGFDAGNFIGAFMPGITLKKRERRITVSLWLLCALIVCAGFVLVYHDAGSLFTFRYTCVAIILFAIFFAIALYPGISVLITLPIATILIFFIVFFFLRYPESAETDPTLNDRQIKYTPNLDYGGVLLRAADEVPLIGGKERFILTEVQEFAPRTEELRELKRTNVVTNAALQIMSTGVLSFCFSPKDVATHELALHKRIAAERTRTNEERNFSYVSDIDEDALSWRVRKPRVSFQSVLKSVIMNAWQAVYNLITRLFP